MDKTKRRNNLTQEKSFLKRNSVKNIFFGLIIAIVASSMVSSYYGIYNFSVETYRWVLLGQAFPWLAVGTILAIVVVVMIYLKVKKKSLGPLGGQLFVIGIFGVFSLMMFSVGGWYVNGALDTPVQIKGKCELLSKSSTGSNGLVLLEDNWYKMLWSNNGWYTLAGTRKDMNGVDRLCPCYYPVEAIVLPNAKMIISIKYIKTEEKNTSACTSP